MSTEVMAPESAENGLAAGLHQMEEQLKAYKALQAMLDRSLPDSSMEMGYGRNKKLFRKKSYWRAVQVHFKLSCEIVSISRTTMPCPKDDLEWGYEVVARVTTQDGRTMDGAGACSAFEKVVYKTEWVNNKKKRVTDPDGNPVIDWVATNENATVHNVRSHAETRAKNRAIADLVGFGEVSAEEMPYHHDDGGGEQRAANPPSSTSRSTGRSQSTNSSTGSPTTSSREEIPPVGTLEFQLNSGRWLVVSKKGEWVQVADPSKIPAEMRDKHIAESDQRAARWCPSGILPSQALEIHGFIREWGISIEEGLRQINEVLGSSYVRVGHITAEHAKGILESMNQGGA